MNRRCYSGGDYKSIFLLAIKEELQWIKEWKKRYVLENPYNNCFRQDLPMDAEITR